MTILAPYGPVPKGIWSWRASRREEMLATCLTLCETCGETLIRARRSEAQKRIAGGRSARGCDTPGCDGPHEARGLCRLCYQRSLRPTVPVTEVIPMAAVEHVVLALPAPEPPSPRPKPARKPKVVGPSDHATEMDALGRREHLRQWREDRRERLGYG